MDKNKKLNDLTINEFFEEIYQQRGINQIWLKVLQLIQKIDSTVSEKILKLLCLYFSLLDDGNICIPLDSSLLFERWNEKWSGLLLVEKRSTWQSLDFKNIIEGGIDEILSKEIPKIFYISENESQPDNIETGKPFIIKSIKGTKWLFAEKFFISKIKIEKRINELFGIPVERISDSRLDEIKKYFQTATAGKAGRDGILLEDRQAEIIAAGEMGNLIVTGGPGTGKTTAICFLLWNLLRDKDGKKSPYANYNIYLAAPSGKAAERIKESISSSLESFNSQTLKDNEYIRRRLIEAEASTIYRLLSYSPAKNTFMYDAENQFSDKSIFIIDEASMIDVELFGTLLEAIPSKAKLFILGDKDQLPSVQAGAVLGELLGKRKQSVIELNVSKRFNEESQVGRLKSEIQSMDDFPEKMDKYGQWLSTADDFQFEEKFEHDKNPVFLYQPSENIKDKKNEIRKIVSKWCSAFCENFIPETINIDRKSVKEADLNSLWKNSNNAKILCAEHKSAGGVENINYLITQQIMAKKLSQPDDDGYYNGQLLMVTENQQLYNLFNGDCGVVVSFNNDNVKYLMVEKKKPSETSSISKNETTGIFRIGNFLFYPVSLLPKESIETSYAITIHKSQGSGYKQILIFLPDCEGHPLLNRQILYTAITRTERNTWIVASRKTLNYAKKKIVRRDTNIEI